MSAEDTLAAWITDLLSDDPDLFLVNIHISSGKGAKKVVIHIDGDQGVPIDTCAQISRALSQRLEEEDVIEGAYTLEVSSPGLSQPLQLQRQYAKNVGRHVKVLTTDDKAIQGELLAVDDTQITIAAETNPRAKKKKAVTKEEVIPFSHIKKTNVLPIFH